MKHKKLEQNDCLILSIFVSKLKNPCLCVTFDQLTRNSEGTVAPDKISIVISELLKLAECGFIDHALFKRGYAELTPLGYIINFYYLYFFIKKINKTHYVEWSKFVSFCSAYAEHDLINTGLTDAFASKELHLKIRGDKGYVVSASGLKHFNKDFPE